MSVLQEVEKKARNYALHNYGNLLSIDEPVFDQKEKTWKVKLKTDYPRLIKNDNPHERFVKTLLVKDIGTIYFDEKLSILRDISTSRNDCVGTLRTRLSSWEKKAENIIVRTSAYQLASTGIARVFLNPINTILANFMEQETEFIPYSEIEKMGRKTERYSQWIRLLEDLEFLRKETEGYKYGNMYTELRRKTSNDQEFLFNVSAHVIRERYQLLRDVFRLNQFDSLIHLDSCYYRPALEASRVLYLKAESLYNRYLSQFAHRSRFELPGILMDLSNSKALMRNGQYYYANQELFNEMTRKIDDSGITITAPRV